MQATRSSDSPRKWILRLRIESVEVLCGGQFVRAGEQVDAVAFDLPAAPAVDERIHAEAEYVGGVRSGTLQLHDVGPAAP